jgi:chromate reductase
MKKIIAFGGSNSSKSINQHLAVHAASLVKSALVTVIDLNDYELPLYNIDIEENDGIPENAKKLKALFDSQDGFIIALPEHNSSFSVFFKNTIDWISRVHMSFFDNKPITLLATSPGPGGGRSVLAHAEKVLGGYLAGKVISTTPFPSYYQNSELTSEGKLTITDDSIASQVQEAAEALELKLTGEQGA